MWLVSPAFCHRQQAVADRRAGRREHQPQRHHLPLHEDDLRPRPHPRQGVHVPRDRLHEPVRRHQVHDQAIKMENFCKLFPQVTYKKSWLEAVEDADGLVILTEWNEFRGLDAIKLKGLMKSPNVLDTRNILNMHEFQNAGFKFDNVGRLPRNS